MTTITSIKHPQSDQPSEPTQWPALTPLLPDPQEAPTLDLAILLPGRIAWLGKFIDGLSDQIGVSPALIAPMSLSLASLAATGAVEYHGREGHVEAPPIWTTTSAVPGERKSPVLRALRPPFAPPKSSIGETTTKVARSGKKAASKEKTIHDEGEEWKQAKGNAASHQEGSSQDDLATPWTELIASDVTPMGLIMAMKDGRERIGVISDEGHPVHQFIDATKHGGLDIFLKGCSGDPVSIRRKDQVISLDHPEVVVGLMVQPEIAARMLTNRDLAERGLPHRMLWSSAPAASDTRAYAESNACPLHLVNAWEESIRSLLAIDRSPSHRKRELHMTKEALRIYGDIYEKLNQEQRNPDRSPFMRQWYGKAHGQALRIAGILTLLGDSSATKIGVEQITAAAAWIKYFAQHTEIISSSSGSTDETVYQARRVVQWLRRHGAASVSRNAITQALRGQDLYAAKDWEGVFDLLVTKGYLREHRAVGGPQGGRPSTVFEVNPEVFSQG
jgi:replicative DNA helicase